MSTAQVTLAGPPRRAPQLRYLVMGAGAGAGACGGGGCGALAPSESMWMPAADDPWRSTRAAARAAVISATAAARAEPYWPLDGRAPPPSPPPAHSYWPCPAPAPAPAAPPLRERSQSALARGRLAHAEDDAAAWAQAARAPTLRAEPQRAATFCEGLREHKSGRGADAQGGTRSVDRAHTARGDRKTQVRNRSVIPS